MKKLILLIQILLIFAPLVSHGQVNTIKVNSIAPNQIGGLNYGNLDISPHASTLVQTQLTPLSDASFYRVDDNNNVNDGSLLIIRNILTGQVSQSILLSIDNVTGLDVCQIGQCDRRLDIKAAEELLNTILFTGSISDDKGDSYLIAGHYDYETHFVEVLVLNEKNTVGVDIEITRKYYRNYNFKYMIAGYKKNNNGFAYSPVLVEYDLLSNSFIYAKSYPILMKPSDIQFIRRNGVDTYVIGGVTEELNYSDLITCNNVSDGVNGGLRFLEFEPINHVFIKDFTLLSEHFTDGEQSFVGFENEGYVHMDYHVPDHMYAVTNVYDHSTGNKTVGLISVDWGALNAELRIIENSATPGRSLFDANIARISGPDYQLGIAMRVEYLTTQYHPDKRAVGSYLLKTFDLDNLNNRKLYTESDAHQALYGVSNQNDYSGFSMQRYSKELICNVGNFGNPLINDNHVFVLGKDLGSSTDEECMQEEDVFFTQECIELNQNPPFSEVDILSSLNMTVDLVDVDRELYDCQSFVVQNYREKVESVDEHKKLSEVVLFPNPVQEILNYKLNVSDLNSVHIEVYNSVGFKIQVFDIVSTEGKLDVSSFKPGVYILNVRYDGKFESFKFIKK